MSTQSAGTARSSQMQQRRRGGKRPRETPGTPQSRDQASAGSVPGPAAEDLVERRDVAGERLVERGEGDDVGVPVPHGNHLLGVQRLAIRAVSELVAQAGSAAD